MTKLASHQYDLPSMVAFMRHEIGQHMADGDIPAGAVIAPSTERAHDLGAIALEAKKWQEAEKHLLAAEERRPDDFMTNYCLAVLYLNIDWGEIKK